MKQLVVNKDDLRHNINKIKEYTKKISNNSNYTIIAVVKANGYGLGLAEYSNFLVQNGIQYLAVATLEEALELKKQSINAHILLLSPLNTNKDMEIAVQNDIIITIDSKINSNIANDLSKKGYNIKAHIKIDTGFGRYGFLYSDKNVILETINELVKNNIKVEGIFSHFSMAYYKNNKQTLMQYTRFKEVLTYLEKNNINIDLKHICNSPAILNYPEMCLNAARIGSAFTGRVCAEENIGLKKIGELNLNVAEIRTLPKDFTVSYLSTFKTKRETKIAVLQIGTAEGYNVGPKVDMFRVRDKLGRIYQQIKALFIKQKLTAVINEKRYDIIGTVRNISCFG